MRRRHGLGADPAVAAGAMTGSNSTTGGKDAMRRALTGAACVAALLAAGSAPALAGKANDTFVWATSTEMDTPDLYSGRQEGSRGGKEWVRTAECSSRAYQ